MENISSVEIRKSLEIDNQTVTIHVPIESFLNRQVIFPDFGIEIGEEEPYSATVTTAEYAQCTYNEGIEIAKEFLNIYPEAVLPGQSKDEVASDIASKFVASWMAGQNLDLTHYNGIKPHAK